MYEQRDKTKKVHRLMKLEQLINKWWMATVESKNIMESWNWIKI